MIHEIPPIYSKDLYRDNFVREFSGRDAPPISTARITDKNNPNMQVYRELFLRALNDNQIFLLKNIDGESRSLNDFLREVTKNSEKPFSTLKLNARILKDLDLITYGSRTDPEPVELT
ncbi:MAG: hypothetical protein ACOC1V_07635, partial [Candidatus Saliniplasma sp.]